MTATGARHARALGAPDPTSVATRKTPVDRPTRQPNHERRAALLMLAPAAVVLAAVFLLPVLYSIWNSVQTMGTAPGEVAYVGTQHYADVMGDPAFWRALRVSLLFTAGCVLGTYVLGLTVALLVDRQAPGGRMLQAATVVPWAMPHVAGALLWATIFDFQYGPANWFLKEIGVMSRQAGWLTTGPLALVSVTLVQVWTLFPLAGVMLLAGLQAIPRERYEAAAVDGASPFQVLRYITLPGLRSVTTILLLLMTIWVFGRSFTVIFVLTGGGPAGATRNLVLEIFHTAFERFNLQAASALGSIVLLVSLLMTVMYWRFAFRETET